MLAVQVSYLGVMETIRHNKIAEQQNARALDQADEKIRQNWISIGETQRHNLAVEAETNRHNVATESLGYANLAFNYASLAETKRHNESVEALTFEQQKETRRHNFAMEGVQQSELTIEFDKMQEQQRANMARERETYRHNMESESIARDEVSISQFKANVQEAQGWASISNAQEANDINRINARTRQQQQELAEKQYKLNRNFGIWHAITDFWKYNTDTIMDIWGNTNNSIRVIGGLRHEQN